jgi:hypothetical protein
MSHRPPVYSKVLSEWRESPKKKGRKSPECLAQVFGPFGSTGVNHGLDEQPGFPHQPFRLIAATERNCFPDRPAQGEAESSRTRPATSAKMAF